MAKVIGMGNDGKPQGNPKIDISKTTELQCAECNGTLFLPAMKFRKLSKVLAGTKKDAIIPIEVFACADCGEIHQELLPPELRSE